MKLILLGPPGSGKGTMSERLTKEFRLKHISPGEIFRDEIEKKTQLGREIKKHMERGGLVPDNLTNEIIKLEIEKQKNFLLDGYPRTLGQAHALDKFAKIDKVLLLEVSEKTVIERISGRRICSQCETPFHIKFIPPKKAGLCDKCGGKLMQRKDDAPASVKKRFQIYNEQVKHLKEFFQRKRLLRRIDASSTPKEVYLEIQKAVKDS
ncbi:MAG TPA: nucleoside monophosphate kinase [Candidatus Nanoarchaeia archaeon]|nr:nucleoside monophosphate kinase [Candidatus Nanoarchaeia archaeon]